MRDQWTEALDNCWEIDVIFMDFIEAFDTVPHKRLIQKLRTYGINGQILDWIKDFLSHTKKSQ